MPLPQAIARANRRMLNPITRRFAGRIRPFAVVEHTGRKSGKTFRTPFMAFQSPEGFAFALTYGPNADWVRNVVAAGECVLEFGGKRISLVKPRFGNREDIRDLLPAFVRLILRALNVDDFLLLSRSDVPVTEDV